MMKSFTIALAALSATTQCVIADTSMAVIPIGSKQNVIRRVLAGGGEEESVSLESVRALWSSLHGVDANVPGHRRLPTTEGMPLVADLFSKPDAGMVVSLVGSDLDLEQMPTLSKLLSEVAHPMTLKAGSYGRELVELAESSNGAMSSKLINVNDSNDAAAADAQLAQLVKKLESDTSRTTVLHLVIDDEARFYEHARRKLQSDEDGAVTSSTAEENGSESYSTGSSDYSKTIFQIQYYQTCLWTAIGLFVILYSSMYMMSSMSFMADTLLFGESAKMPTD
jgi:hypothetical protein